MADKPKMPAAVKAVFDEIDTLVKTYIGKSAESEPWLDTLNRIERLGKIAKKAKATFAAEKTATS